MALFIDLDEIPSMTEKVQKILKNNGFTDASALSVARLNELVAIGIDSDVAESLMEEAEELMKKSHQGFITGDELLEALEVDFMKTGCEDLDEILGGGLETKRLYEFYGENGAGKTNLLIQLASMAIRPKEEGGLGTHVIFLDAEGNFRAEKIRKIAERFGLKYQYVVKNVSRYLISDVNELRSGVEKSLIPIMKKKKARVVILDSLTSKFRSEYIGEALLPLRQGILGRIAHALKTATQTCNAIAIVANQVTSNPDTKVTTYAGGNIIGHEVQVRVAIIKILAHKYQRKFYVEKAVDLPNDSCLLWVDARGFHDFGSVSEDELDIETTVKGAKART